MPIKYLNLRNEKPSSEQAEACLIHLFTFGEEPKPDLSNVFLVFQNKSYKEKALQLGASKPANPADNNLLISMLKSSHRDYYGQFKSGADDFVTNAKGEHLVVDERVETGPQTTRRLTALVLDTKTSKDALDETLDIISQTNVGISRMRYFLTNTMMKDNEPMISSPTHNAPSHEGQACLFLMFLGGQEEVNKFEKIPSYAMEELRKIAEGESELLKQPFETRECEAFINGTASFLKTKPNPCLGDFSGAFDLVYVNAKALLNNEWEIFFPREGWGETLTPTREQWTNLAPVVELLNEYQVSLEDKLKHDDSISRKLFF